jgi:hypothetical protein
MSGAEATPALPAGSFGGNCGGWAATSLADCVLGAGKPGSTSPSDAFDDGIASRGAASGAPETGARAGASPDS